MIKHSSLVPADLIVSLESDLGLMHAIERAMPSLQAMKILNESIGLPAAFVVEHAALRCDPARSDLKVDIGDFLPPELKSSSLVAQVLTETKARLSNQIVKDFSSVSAQCAKLSTTRQMVGIGRQAMINAVAPVALFGPSILSDFATFSFAAQALDNLRKVTIGLPPMVPWDGINRRLRVRQWLTELGSDDDPGSVELVELDGTNYGQEFQAFWYAFLGEPVDGRLGRGDQHIISVGGLTLRLWGVRIYRDDTDSFGEIRLPPWGNGDLDLRQIDPFRPSGSQRILRGLRALGYGRRRGRQPLADVWEADEFHRAYRHADSVVRARRAGRRGSQLEVAGELGMSDRHLRRLITLHGLPDEKRS